MTSLLNTHDLGGTTDQMISNLRRSILPQRLPEAIDKGIQYSKDQYKHVVEETEKEGSNPVLSKKSYSLPRGN